MTDLPATTHTLADLELIIETGIQTFVDVGLALMEVRDRKLYEQAGYVNFEMYCHGRWGFRASRGRQLIGAARTAKMLASGDEEGVTNVTPTNEAQARELAPLARTDPDAARAVWSEGDVPRRTHTFRQLAKSRSAWNPKRDVALSASDEAL